MGQFKPMVKMMTTEPSVILKLKKGGKVASKADGGYMPMQSTMPAQAMPARGGMAPAASPMAPSMMARRRAMMAKPAMNPTMMKEGGKADMAQDKAMIKKAFKQHDMQEHASGKGTKLTLKKGGKTMACATGGVILGNGGGYKDGGMAKGGKMPMKDGKPAFLAKGMMDGGKACATGGVINGNGGGYATGGVALGNGGGYKMGGTIKGGNFENRPADTAKAGKSGGTTGGVRNGNAGGYKMGGTAKKAYATGGKVDSGKAEKMPSHKVSRPVANSLQSGTFAKGGKVEKEEKPNLRLVKTYTGPKGHVAKVYKDRDWQEYRTKFYTPEGKYLTEGDSHTDDAKDAHDTAQSEVNKARYKKGGKVNRYESGGSSLVDASKGQYDKAIGPSEEEMDMAKAIRSVPRKLYEGAKGMLGFGSTPKPAGSVTKTEKSVTVAPATKKRGGRC